MAVQEPVEIAQLTTRGVVILRRGCARRVLLGAGKRRHPKHQDNRQNGQRQFMCVNQIPCLVLHDFLLEAIPRLLVPTTGHLRPLGPILGKPSLAGKVAAIGSWGYLPGNEHATSSTGERPSPARSTLRRSTFRHVV